MMASIRRCAAIPYEYTNSHLRRQIVMFVCNLVEYLYPMLHVHVKGNYGHARLSKSQYKKKDRAGTFARSLFQQLCKVLFTQQLVCQVLISIYVRFSCLFLLGLCINIYCTTLGNVARVYPWIVQGLTFLSA